MLWKFRSKAVRGVFIGLLVAGFGAVIAVAYPAGAAANEADLRLSTFLNFPLAAVDDNVERVYLLSVSNDGPVRVSNFRILVTSTAPAIVKLGTSLQDGVGCGLATACSHVFPSPVNTGASTMAILRVLAPPGSQFTAEVRVPDEYTDPDPDNTLTRTLPIEAKLAMTLAGRAVVVQPPPDIAKGTRFTTTVHNGGPAAVATVAIRVEVADDDATIRIGPEGAESVCRRVSTCEYTYTMPGGTPLRPGQDLAVSVAVVGVPGGTDVTIRARTRGGFTDPDLSDNDLVDAV